VHRKRSQVAVVAEDGQVQVNRNVVNGVEPILEVIGDLPSGTGRVKSPNHSCSRSKPSPPGLPGSSFGPAMYPSSDIDM
jgi:hypothetical protein